MTAICPRGQAAVPSNSKVMAWAGEAGNWGHHQVTSGCRVRTSLAMVWALTDCGDDLKPCKYSRWVVATVRQISILEPNSTTALVGKFKNAAAPLALWCIWAKSFSRQVAMPPPMVGITMSRDKK